MKIELLFPRKRNAIYLTWASLWPVWVSNNCWMLKEINVLQHHDKNVPNDWRTQASQSFSFRVFLLISILYFLEIDRQDPGNGSCVLPRSSPSRPCSKNAYAKMFACHIRALGFSSLHRRSWCFIWVERTSEAIPGTRKNTFASASWVRIHTQHGPRRLFLCGGGRICICNLHST